MKPLDTLAEYKNRMRAARRNNNGWDACQDMGWAARYAPEEKVLPAANEALKLARSLPDDYERVAIQAWPLCALIERGHDELAAENLPALLELSHQITILICRCDALFLAWEAVAALPLHITEPLLNQLIRDCLNSGSWKGSYLLRDLALQVVNFSEPKADAIAASIPPGKYQRQALKRLASGEKLKPREFFW